MSGRERERKRGHHASLNGVVYCLIVLAVALSGIATWQRYSQRRRAGPGETAERRLDTVLAGAGIPESWVPAAGPRQERAARAMRRFVCPQCQSTCWTPAYRGCPACPFCGRAMIRSAPAQQGVRTAPAGAALSGSPVPIRPDALRPHPERGPCTNCHTVVRSGVSPPPRTAAATPRPQRTLRRAPPPPVAVERVRPTLIRQFGMEVSPAPGTGVKVTGVMGNSHAWNAGLRVGDVVIACNGVRVGGVRQLQRLLARAPPEADAWIKILRNGRTRDLAVMVGEGEMEGFTPMLRA